MTNVSPYLLYEDAGAAIDWLVATLGFTERERMKGGDGAVMHGEVALGSGIVMLGCPGASYEGPAKKGYQNAYVHVYVDDVDTHFRYAKAAGAKILSEPTDQPYGDRQYACEDPEGHRWYFAQRLASD